MRPHGWVTALGLALLALGGCAGGGGDDTELGDAGRSPRGDAGDGGDAGPDSPQNGADVYGMPFLDGNTFACATCHALSEPSEDGLRRPGHPIGDAANRPSYKNGALSDLRAAVNTCVEEWMVAEPLAENDPRWQLLRDFLQERAGDSPAAEIEIQVVEPPRDLDGGDAVAGMQLFDASCAVCHGAGAAGAPQAPSLIGSRLSAETIARRIRTSGRADSPTYEGLTGGVMPFWGLDRLSEAELLDVVAYVEEIGAAERQEMEGDSGATGESGCGETHPLVGATATFETFAHDVRGTARVVDDCTIRLEDFSFDGGGIVVEVYGGVGGDFDPPVGFSMSDNLLGQVFDEGSLTVRLPEGKTLDDLDGVSIWCVAVGTSFGDALF